MNLKKQTISSLCNKILGSLNVDFTQLEVEEQLVIISRVKGMTRSILERDQNALSKGQSAK